MENCHFEYPRYLIVQGWSRANLVYTTNIHLTMWNVTTPFFPWVDGYDLIGNTTVPCHKIEAASDVPNRLVTTAFAAP